MSPKENSIGSNAGGVFFITFAGYQKIKDMTFEITKTEYIAVIAGMDCLPRTNEDENYRSLIYRTGSKGSDRSFC